MEAKDPARDSPAAGRDGPADEEGGILSVTAALAKEAALLFQAKRYADCVGVLAQILQKKEDDPKVLHNIALAEFCRDGCTDPGKLLDNLQKVKKKCEELAHTSGTQLEHAIDLQKNVREGGTTFHQFSAGNAVVAYPDVFDTSIVTLNMAFIRYHLHDYTSASSLLVPLYRSLAPIDEATALHVCLLLLDVSLASENASMIADVLQFLERSFGVRHMLSQGDNIISHHFPSNQTLKVSTASSGLGAPDSSDSATSPITAEGPLVGNLSDDVAEYENLISTLDNSVQNSEQPLSDNLLRPSTNRFQQALDVKLKLQFYKVRFLLLTRNLKAAKREIKLAINDARGKDSESSMALLLKSQIEYACGNYQKAIKLLNHSSSRTETVMPGIFKNNLGCILHHLGKPHLSAVEFFNALRSSASMRSEKPCKLYTLSKDKSLLITYNCGLENLSCGKPLLAARCFHKAMPLFSRKPLLWLRFAECCLMALEKGLLKSNGSSSYCGEEAKVHVVGSGKWRQLIIESNSRKRMVDMLAEDGLISEDDNSRLSIPFARQCLKTALHLLNVLELKNSNVGGVQIESSEEESNEIESSNTKNSNQKTMPSGGDGKASNSDLKETKGGMSSNNPFQTSVSAFEDLSKEENLLVKQTILADLAYLELCLENPMKALSAANVLQRLSADSRIYSFLSHLYAAEALCRLNRPKEASERLLVYISDGDSIELPYSIESIKKWSPYKSGDGEEVNATVANEETSKEDPQVIRFLKPEISRGILYTNLAILCSIQGDLEQANKFVQKATSMSPGNSRAFLAALYVDLLLGKTGDALERLKHGRCFRFFPTGVTSSN